MYGAGYQHGKNAGLRLIRLKVKLPLLFPWRSETWCDWPHAMATSITRLFYKLLPRIASWTVSWTVGVRESYEPHDYRADYLFKGWRLLVSRAGLTRYSLSIAFPLPPVRTSSDI